MKGIFIIIDGLGDLPCILLNNKTPLEAARTPNLDIIARKSKLGYMYSIKEGVVPESDSAILSLFGCDYYVGYRGSLEALGSDIEIKHGDLAIRTNFATIDNLENKEIVDRRAGRNLTTKEALILAKEINKKVKLQCKFIFKPTIQHRGVLVLKGGFSDNITNTDPAYHKEGKSQLSNKFKFSMPLDEEDITHFTANIVNDFIEKSHKVLEEHLINKERKKKGLLPANIILTRDASIDLPNVKKLKKWASMVYMPLEIGISKALNIIPFTFSYPELKSYDVYENLNNALKIACNYAIKVIKKQFKKYDYLYIHFKEIDVPGHDNKPLEKKAMIEILDKNFFSYIVKFLNKFNVKLLVTADHSTPCSLRGHSDDAVPVLYYNKEIQIEKEQRFTEKDSKKGDLGKLYGKELLKKTGFT
ncbi:MAG: alkaline phosphatase family protein [Candidatus Pacearchaeota archaeon]